jgi:tetratricopeptide (TPR) repeat protein
MAQIESGFAKFAKAKAEALGPGLDWKKSGPNVGRRRPGAADGLSFLTASNPPATSVGDITNLQIAAQTSGKPNYWALQEQAEQLIAEKNWTAALGPLETLIALCPSQSGPNNAYAALAEVQRERHEVERERAALEQWAAQDAAAPDAYLRLMELSVGPNDWQAVAQNAERFLAVNPLVPPPYRYLGQAREALGDPPPAIDAYQKLLLLEPADPADVHFRLARLLHLSNDPAAKRHVLQALEEAPRFRAAHRLLLELAPTESSSTNAAPNPTP